MNTFVKHRTGASVVPSLSEQGKKRIEKEERIIAEGLYDRFTPGEVAIWINISPNSSYEYKIYDRASGEVVDTVTTWLEVVQHYHPKTKRSLNCSAGPYMDKPCISDIIRKRFYDRRRQIEERTGVQPKGEPPIGRASRFIFAITVMEDVCKVPLLDNKTGGPRKRRDGTTILRLVPAPLVDTSSGVKYPTVLGYRYHWGIGREQLQQVIDFDEDLSRFCGHCAEEMLCDALVCPECTNQIAKFEMVKGEDLHIMKNKDVCCPHCSTVGKPALSLLCPGCGSPEPGRLTGFDVRIKRVPLQDNRYQLKIVGVRMPRQDEELQKHIANPLDLSKIYAPTPMREQQDLLSDEIKEFNITQADFNNPGGASLESVPYGAEDVAPDDNA